MKLRKIGFNILKISLSLSLLGYIIVYHVHPNQILPVFKQISIFHILLATTILLINRWLIAMQTSIAFRYTGISIDTKSVFKVQLISNFYSFFLPGELASAGVSWYMFTKLHSSKLKIAVVLAYIKFLNLFILVPFVLISLWMIPEMLETTDKHLIIIWSAAMIVAFLVIISTALHRMIEYIFSRIKILSKYHYILDEAKELQLLFSQILHPKIRKILLLAVVIYATNVLLIWFLAYSLNMYINIPVLFVVYALLVVVSFIPVFFAGIGLREMSLIYFLSKFGFSEGQSFVYSILFFLLNLIILLLGGILNLTYTKKQDALSE